MKHELNIWPQYYTRVADGSKTFEIRNNDRGFQAGDIVDLREFDPKLRESFIENDCYTNSPILRFKIGYVLTIDSERVVFSLLHIEDKNEPV